MKGTKKLAVCAMLTALSVVVLYGACLAPTGRLVLLAVAALLPAAAVLAGGLRWGLLTYAATAVLGLLLLPDLRYSLAYAVLLGHYSIWKSLVERVRSRALEWVLKLAVWNGLLAVTWGLFRLLFAFELGVSLALLWLLGNVVFAVFDVAATQLLTRMGPLIRRIL